MNLGITFTDGDWTVAQPDGAPEIYYPFEGDSIPGVYPLFLYTDPDYDVIPVGTSPNLQPPNTNARAIIIEQDFMVQAAVYTPMLLNTAYNPAWSLGWNGPDDLSTCFLINEGRVEPIVSGIVKVRRTFANLPPSRNRYESFTFQFPGYTTNGGTSRQSFSMTVNSRLQSDFFLLSNFNNALPPIIPQFLVFEFEDGNVIIDPPALADPNMATSSFGTTPPLASYVLAIGNQEIVAETSHLNKWRGNIYERVTRFVVAR
jgi:hypothetical protein